MRDRALCRVHRARFRDRVAGYIVGVGPRWVLMAVVGAGFRMDGFRAFRIRDLSRLDAPLDSRGFIATAHRLFRISPPKMPTAELTSLAALFRSIPARYGPIAVHTELARPHVCFIATVQRVSAREVWLRTITPDAVWEVPHTSYKLSDVTRITIADEYVLALLELNAARAAAVRRSGSHRGSA